MNLPATTHELHEADLIFVEVEDDHFHCRKNRRGPTGYHTGIEMCGMIKAVNNAAWGRKPNILIFFKRCQERESGGVQCEFHLGHSEKCGCPSAFELRFGYAL